MRAVNGGDNCDCGDGDGDGVREAVGIRDGVDCDKIEKVVVNIRDAGEEI